MGAVTAIHQHGRHCGECRSANVEVLRYDTFYKLVECSDCGETTHIPKRCASSWDRFREWLKGERDTWRTP